MSETTSIFPTVQRTVLVDCIVGQPDDINPIRDSKSVICHGLIDTGAEISAISTRVVEHLGLVATGSQEVTAANKHTDVVDTHIVNVGIGGDVRFPLIQVSCLDMDDEDMIIGMDLLSMGDLVISNSLGHTVFMFKIDDD